MAETVECVPNVSEGRRPEVVAALVGAVQVPGVRLLDRHGDADHNRTVLTLAGPPAPLAEAAFRLAEAAVQNIDLTRHRGAHPRMGAIDVIPFVPLGGAMPECVELARGLARRLGGELGLPAYLYGAAAEPGRPAGLAQIRDGGFERLLALGDALPAPDFGPARLHPTAGAVAVGARPPLIAFNVVLEGVDLAGAARIARALRASGGGLAAVQAIALPLASRGAVQVSMNLLDHGVTSLAEVVARLRTLTAGEGGDVVEAELVGLIPAAALRGLDDDPLPGLPGRERTIEARLGAG
ncbi:MAG TPA: glutamate formimidoyltransferase [Candidatus Dormibacteraeota bacterium]|jgi:glutamate formiminotransferase|nr:glutamate formimidoyltransferase [Candidatus Dormibacteraeota bacterium]